MLKPRAFLCLHDRAVICANIHAAQVHDTATTEATDEIRPLPSNFCWLQKKKKKSVKVLISPPLHPSEQPLELTADGSWSQSQCWVSTGMAPGSRAQSSVSGCTPSIACSSSAVYPSKFCRSHTKRYTYRFPDVLWMMFLS